MPSRQDQLHSYQYSQQRVVAALVSHDADPSRSPLRRAGTTALVSLLIASLAVGGALIYGFVTGQSRTNPKDPAVVFQEKGTGARYVFLESDNRLHPVLNYTSGMLLTKGQVPQMKSISAQKLATVDQGDPVGIPGAPDSLPSAKVLNRGLWSICTDNGGQGGAPRSTLLLGDKLSDGTPLAVKVDPNAPVVAPDRALLVRDPNNRTWLVAANRRFAFPEPTETATLRALGWGEQQPWPVSRAWITTVPRGPDLNPPKLPRPGGRSAAVPDQPVGALVTDGTKFAVVFDDGLAAITDMQARLVQTLPGIGTAKNLGSAFIRIPAATTSLSDVGQAGALPQLVPVLVGGTPTRLCNTPRVGTDGDGVRIDPTVPQGRPVTGKPLTPDSPLADLVHIGRGRGVLARVQASPGAPSGAGTVSVVTDTGTNYPLASQDLVTKLGYAKIAPNPIPAELLSLLPMGPALDPVKARQAVTAQ